MSNGERTKRLHVYDVIKNGAPGTYMVNLCEILRLIRDNPDALAVAGIENEIAVIIDESCVTGCRFDWMFPLTTLTEEEERWVRRAMTFSKFKPENQIIE